MVFKYGPVEPRRPAPNWPPGRTLIKYAPPEPFGPQIVDKYAPIEPNKPGAKPKDNEVKLVLKEIARCLKKIQKLLDKAELGTIAEELRLTIAELSFLYLKLNDLQKNDKTEIIEIKSKRQGRDFVILYIVMTPAKPPK